MVNECDTNKQASLNEPWEEQVISTELTQEGDEETFEFMSMTKEEDQQNCTPQLSPSQKKYQKHQITWDKYLTVAQGVSEKRAKLRKQNAVNSEAAAEKEVQAKEEIAAVCETFSKQQLLNMIIPVSQTSKNKASKAEKKKLEEKSSFSHVLDKVRKKKSSRFCPPTF